MIEIPKYESLQRRVESLEAELEMQKAQYQELKISQNLLKELVDTIEGEAFIKDQDGRYLFVNKAYGNDFGVDPEEVVGKDDYFVFDSETAVILQENDRKVIAAGKAVNIKESTILKGRPVTYLTNKVPLMDEMGNVIGICGVGFDITEQERIEKALKDAQANLERQVKERTAQLSNTVDKLREAELRYRTVADFTYDWEYWINEKGSLEYVSPSCERISGYMPGQFMDRPELHQEIIADEDKGIWCEHEYDSRQKPMAREIQFRIHHRDGSIRWIEHVCQPVTDQQGNVLGFRANNRDITRRKESEIELRNAYNQINALKKELEAEQIYLREEIKLAHNYEDIIGDSDVMKYILYSLEQIAPTDTTVLITGESGTGKELIARAIHYHSKRKARPLIKVDCASLPGNLIESELFGHEKGAFTSAVEKRIGRFELANRATIFLDEVGELPLPLQQKLLRVLQDGEYERLGSAKVRRTDIRVIAATNRNLEDDVLKGRFRKDLWYRLNVLPLSLPPLRDRVEDIPLLVNWIVKKAQRRHGKQITIIPGDFMEELKAYSWPGNVRELENVIERAVIFTQGGRLRLAASLQAKVLEMEASSIEQLKSLSEMEKKYILLALERTHWNVTGRGGAAELLDINPSTLRGRMRKHGIRRPSLRA